MKRAYFFAALAIIVAALVLGFSVRADALLTAVATFNGGTGTTTTPAYGQLLVGGKNGEYELVASSTLFGGGLVNSIFGRTGAITAQTGDYTTAQVPESGNLYFTTARAVSALTGQNLSIFANNAGYVTSSFSTTSAAYWQTQNNFFSTTSASAFIALNQGAAFSTSSASAFLALNQGNAFSTTSANVWGSAKGYLTSLAGAASSTLLTDNDTFTGNLTLATTTTASLNGVITVSGWPFPETCAGINKAITIAANGAVVFLAPGIYPFSGCYITFQGKTIHLIGSGQGSTVFQSSGAGEIYDYFGSGSVPANRSNDEISEITFDMNSVSNESAIQMGSSQNLYIHNDTFTNNKGIWNVAIGGIGGTLGSETLQDIANSSSTNFIFENNIISSSTDGTSEALLCTNCSNGKIIDNIFSHISGGSGTLALYAYNRNMTVSGNTFDNDAIQTAYIQQSDNVIWSNNSYYNGSPTIPAPLSLKINNSQNINVTGNNLYGDLRVSDSGGQGFDGHIGLYATSSGLQITNNNFNDYYYGVVIGGNGDTFAGETDINILNNTFNSSVIGSGWTPITIGDTNATGMARINIIGNVASTSDWFGTGAITIQGSSTAPSNISNVTIENNSLSKSVAGGNWSEIYVDGASNVRIGNNITPFSNGSFNPIQITSNVNNVIQSGFDETTGFTIGTSTTGNIFSIQPNGAVGIGTKISLAKPLTIQANINRDLLQLRDSIGNSRWLLSIDDGPQTGLDFTENGVANDRLFLQAGGNVGLGTGGPNNNISVLGNASIGSNSAAPANGLLVQGTTGIGTTSPGSIFSIGVSGNASGINLGFSTSTFSNAGGINLTTGCFAINGNCLSLTSFGGTLPIANGGTNQTSQTTNGVNYFDGTHVTSGSSLTWNGSQLGIGVTSPTRTVDIAASMPGGGQILRLVNTSGSVGDKVGIEFRPSNLNASQNASIYANAPGSSNQDLQFYTVSGGTGQQSVTILGGPGNLGVGTTSPGTLLSLGTGFSFINLNNSGVSTFANGITILSGGLAVSTSTLTGSLSVSGASWNTINGVCYQVKSTGSASSYTYWYFNAAHAMVTSGTTCSGVSTTTITED